MHLHLHLPSSKTRVDIVDLSSSLLLSSERRAWRLAQPKTEGSGVENDQLVEARRSSHERARRESEMLTGRNQTRSSFLSQWEAFFFPPIDHVERYIAKIE